MQSPLRTLRRLRFFTPLGGLLLLVQCDKFSSESGPSTSTGGSLSANGGSLGGTGGEGADSGGTGGGTPCPTTWENCPPMDTVLEPLHERQNGAGSLLLAHSAFWLQGLVVFRNPDGSRAEEYRGALRIPYEPGSTPRVLEGNVAIGAFASYDGKVYHPDFNGGGHLAVYESNGDLHHLLDVTQGDLSATLLQSPTFIDRTLILTTPNCRALFFINIDDWSMERLDIDAKYSGGVTSLTLVEDELYCIGDAYIFKISLGSRRVTSEWRNPELEMGVQGIHYSWAWQTPQGLLTWRRSQNAGDESRFQLLDPETLSFEEYTIPNVSFLGGPRYRKDENTVYFNYSFGIDLGNALHAFDVASKEVRPIVPAERPWGGAWNPASELQMDEDYYYWVERWNPDGTTSLNSAEFIVRYPRNH